MKPRIKFLVYKRKSKKTKQINGKKRRIVPKIDCPQGEQTSKALLLEEKQNILIDKVSLY